MKKISLFAALVVAMGAVSCVQDINDGTPVNNDGAKTFEASFGAMGKAVLEPGETESKVAWEVNDQVSVLAGGENYLYTATSAGYSTTLSTEATGVPAEGTFYAVYPYDNAAALADGKVSTTLPAEQAAVLGSFSTHLAVAQTTGTRLEFKNVCGLVKVTVSDAAVTKVEFKGNTNEIVAGGVSVTVTDTPAWTETETGSQVVTLVPAGEAATLAKGVYYLAVLPQTFAGGITVTAYKGDEAWDVRKVETPVTVERSDIKGSNSFGVEGSGTEADPYILDAAQDLVEMRNLATYGGETWFKMVKDIDMKGITDYIPVNNVVESDAGEGQTFERKIHFDGGNHTISNFTCSDNNNEIPYPSVFGVLYGSCKDLNITNATITSTGQVAGILGGYVGAADKPATVTNVDVQGTVTSSVGRSGGFAGNVVGATFVDCNANVTINGIQDVGGFVGKVQGESSFTRCNATAIVKCSGANKEKHRAAGFVGYVNGTTVTFDNCHVLEGSDIEDTSGNTAKHLVFLGGFMAYSGSSTLTKVSGCTSDAVISAPLGQNVGGFVAIAGTGKLEVIGASSAGSIAANINVGGFIGAQEVAATVEISTSSSSVDITATGNFVGGFAGNMTNAAGKTIKFTDCHATGKILSGSSAASAFVGYVTSDAILERCYATGTMTSVKNNCGGIIGYIVDGKVKLIDCYYTGSISAAGAPLGGVVGFLENKNATADLTIDGCYSTADITTTSGGGIGGLAGDMKGKITIADCYATGNITPKNQNNGGLVGLLRSTASVSRSYATGNINGGSYNRCGGLIGYVGAQCDIENCYATGNVTSTGAQLGGLVAFAETNTSNISIVNSFATGDVKTGNGSGGIIGSARGSANQTSVVGCIAWNTNIETTNRTDAFYAPGAIVGSSYNAGTFKNCWRRFDMSLVDNIGKSVLFNMDDYENAQLPIPDGVTGDHNRSYHGKAAAADATISSVARTLGWSTDIWDLSKDVPTLK